MKKFLLIILIPLLNISQNNQIYIDGTFEDWNNINNYIDSNDNIANGVDFLNVSITNDSQYLYIKFETSNEIDLSDGMNNIELMIDTDNDKKTGWQPGFNNNIGVELGIMFNQRFVWYNVPNPDLQLSFYDIGIYPAPTVTSNTFEIAVDLEAQYNDTPLFPNSEIKLQLTDWSSLDNIPENGLEIIYNINDNFISYSPIDINKESSNLVRLTAYNVLNNGFNNENRLPKLKNIIQALNADIFAFSECANTSEETVKNILDEILPIEVSTGWFVVKKENDDLILASQYPIIEHWPNEANGINAMHPCLIDLPDNLYETDLLVINAHMSCCDNDNNRQNQADDFVNFILDAKNQGGEITIDPETPFILCGDLNLVGFSQQLTTILSGEIIDTDIYGPGGGMNWSNNDLKDQICWNTELPLSYTWRDLYPNEEIPGSYPPGRLDFIIFSDDIITAKKSFSLDTEFMSQGNLNSYDLSYEDSSGSDHLAITTDFEIPLKLSSIDSIRVKKKIINSFDIIGRDSHQNKLQINMYDNGQIEKKYKIK